MYSRFKPDEQIIKRMNLDAYIESDSEEDANLTLDFTSFLLRYHKSLNYEDFSDDPLVIQKIKRAEMYRNWVDIEDLANGYEVIQNNFTSYKETSSKAFQELLGLVDGVKGDLLDKISQNHNSLVDTKINLLDALGQLEKGNLIQQQHSDGIKHINAQFRDLEIETEKALTASNRMLKEMMNNLINEKIRDVEFSINSRIMGRIDLLEKNVESHNTHFEDMEERFGLEKSKLDKSEKITKTMHDVIEKLDEKINRNSGLLENTKKVFLTKIENLETEFIAKIMENDPLKKFNFPAHEESLKKLEDAVEILEEEFEIYKKKSVSQRDKDFAHIRACQKDCDALLQGITENKIYITDINKKAQAFNEDVTRTTQELNKRVNETHMEIQRMTNETSNKLSDLYKLITDIRKDKTSIEAIANDYAKMLESFKSQMYTIIQNKITESFGSSKDIKKRLDLVVEEADELWQFNQRFIDEHAIDRERMMLAPDMPIVRKMEILEWFSRYAEFLSANHAFQCIITFKDQFIRGLQKEEYIGLEHENDSIIMMIDLAERSAIEVKNTKDKQILAKLEARLSVRLNLIEPMIVNFQNLDMAINRNLVDILMDLCRTQEIKDDNPSVQIKVYLKY